ncbi:pyridoxal 5'-phosphate synthase [Bacillus sp. REN3]|uniref:pyridoxine/pyridoxamine 5'-phosphate oxidase n=1 Tax=Bacillus sp. REN3 TaxID=2802440 RepID=UPI001AEE7220|nr:pyridoxal 5'-phosphate synthase [Bacillus sp. REN3]
MDNLTEKLGDLKALEGPFPSFDLEHLPDHPYPLFAEWFDSVLAYKVKEPHAMTLSTVDENGVPDARVLILKDADEHGWYFASSSQSRKGKQIQENPAASLTFYWPVIGRQVRIRGMVRKMDAERSASDFLARGKVARATALAGRQSDLMETREEIDAALSKQLMELDSDPGLIYPFWTLYRLEANEVEFWQGDEGRKHHRVRYTSLNNEWLKDLLWP